MIYLASLPRSGSTLLGSLLNQRDDVFASKTSNLCATLGSAIQSWERKETSASDGSQEDLHRILAGIADNRYDTDKLVFDKGRSWVFPQVMDMMEDVTGEVKIVATVRPVVECLASLVKISPEPILDLKDFCKNGKLAEHFLASHAALREGYKYKPDNFLLIEYHDLVDDTQEQMDKIADFVGISYFKHDLNNIAPSGEKDVVWGIKNLHALRPTVSHNDWSAEEVLGSYLCDYYQGGEFWNDKPTPVRGIDLLDLQLEASLRGDFEKSSQMAKNLLIDRPDCNRVKFNAGWHALREGQLQEGHTLLDFGRQDKIFGNKTLSTQPKWSGETNCTVLLDMEGGQGDQIKSFRFASDIQARGNKVVIAAHPDLAPMFAEKFITVQHEATGGVYHDFYTPSMSAVLPLGYEYEDLSGEPYIERTAEPVKGRVGLRWSGNPQFEHEQHRKFPIKLMFDAVRNLDCVSLQRDTDDVPNWMDQPSLETWNDTRKAISECELVISSCTSVAHLAAAMGVKTWIVVPVLSYYLWALPGNTSPYYDSVTLFRQEKYGDWSSPFEKIKEQLQCMHMLKTAA